MIDCHIHIERGTYSLNWINEFVQVAVDKGIREIWLLEHCYRFREFLPMYESVCTHSEYINKWFHRKAGALELSDFLRLIDIVRQRQYPVDIKFGLEICYFKDFEELVYDETKGKGLDFLVGSVHFVDDFAYDHKAEHWDGVNVDEVYRRYFETSIDLAKSGIYDGIAHPDCIKLFGQKPSFSLNVYYDKLAESLAKSNMYAEQNGGAYRRCPDTTELGMNTGMIKAMKNHGVRILTASDAHCPMQPPKSQFHTRKTRGTGIANPGAINFIYR
jgi:histidinol-phosphatase (PHP family)